MIDDFSNSPPSIGEIRCHKTQSALDWKPRDALVWMLREIDAGRIDCHHLVLSWVEIVPPVDSRRYLTNYKQAGGGDYPWDALGLLTRVQTLIQETNAAR